MLKGNTRLNDPKYSRSYVYAAFYQGVAIYIGKGTGDRWKHCIGGASTSDYLNFLHFQGEDVCVRILCDDLSGECAYALEQELIRHVSPIGNKSCEYPYIERFQAELDARGVNFKKMLWAVKGFYMDCETLHKDEHVTHKNKFPNVPPFVSDIEYPYNTRPKKVWVKKTYQVTEDTAFA